MSNFILISNFDNIDEFDRYKLVEKISFCKERSQLYDCKLLYTIVNLLNQIKICLS